MEERTVYRKRSFVILLHLHNRAELEDAKVYATMDPPQLVFLSQPKVLFRFGRKLIVRTLPAILNAFALNYEEKDFFPNEVWRTTPSSRHPERGGDIVAIMPPFHLRQQDLEMDLRSNFQRALEWGLLHPDNPESDDWFVEVDVKGNPKGLTSESLGRRHGLRPLYPHPLVVPRLVNQVGRWAEDFLPLQEEHPYKHYYSKSNLRENFPELKHDDGSFFEAWKAPVLYGKHWEWKLGRRRFVYNRARLFEFVRTTDEETKEEAATDNGGLPEDYEEIEANDYTTYPGGKSAMHLREDFGKCQCKELYNRPCVPGTCSNAELLFECFGKGGSGSNCSFPEGCRNRRIARKEFAQVQLAPEPGMGTGVQAAEPILAGAFIGEYVGEVIDAEEKERREEANEWQYILELRNKAYVDAYHKGNNMRYVNHSCDPNATAEEFDLKGYPRVILVAMQDIAEGEFIHFDYGNPYFEEGGISCGCGTTKCRMERVQKAWKEKH